MANIHVQQKNMYILYGV